MANPRSSKLEGSGPLGLKNKIVNEVLFILEIEDTSTLAMYTSQEVEAMLAERGYRFGLSDGEMILIPTGSGKSHTDPQPKNNSGDALSVEAATESRTCRYPGCNEPVDEDTQWCSTHRCAALTKSGNRCKNSVDCMVHSSKQQTSATVEVTAEPITPTGSTVQETDENSEEKSIIDSAKETLSIGTPLLSEIISTAISSDEEVSINRFNEAVSTVFRCSFKPSNFVRAAIRSILFRNIDYYQLATDFRNSDLSKKKDLSSTDIEEFLISWLWKQDARPSNDLEEFQDSAFRFYVEQNMRKR